MQNTVLATSVPGKCHAPTGPGLARRGSARGAKPSSGSRTRQQGGPEIDLGLAAVSRRHGRGIRPHAQRVASVLALRPSTQEQETQHQHGQPIRGRSRPYRGRQRHTRAHGPLARLRGTSHWMGNLVRASVQREVPCLLAQPSPRGQMTQGAASSYIVGACRTSVGVIVELGPPFPGRPGCGSLELRVASLQIRSADRSRARITTGEHRGFKGADSARIPTCRSS